MKQLLTLVALLYCLNITATDRNLLQNTTTKEQLAEVLAKGTEWVTFPAYENRAAWGNLPEKYKADLIQSGEKSLDFEWGIIKATDYLEFTRSGNRNVMQNPENARIQNLQNLVLAELVEGKGRFIDAIINGVWAVCEQSTWVLSAHLPSQKKGAGLPDPDDIIIDLGSGRTAAFMAWIHYYFAAEFDKISPFVAQRIRNEINTRILVPYYSRNDFWWMGFQSSFVNNWNIWVNYNVLQCILLIETDFDKRVNNVYKLMKSADKFLNYYKDDGACDEGPSYWSHAGGKLFECLELLDKATKSEVNIFDNSLVKNIGSYIYAVYINDHYFVNFADAAAKGGINSGLVYRYGKAINDPQMQGFGAFYAKRNNIENKVPGGTLETIIHDMFDYNEIVGAKTVEPLIGEHWFEGTQLLIAREKAGAKNGFFFAAKGGHNNESHNHNDVGSFILYCNGFPAIVDAGVGTYTRQTFSSERYSIWTMQSGYHNLPIINGTQQKAGRKFAAKNVNSTLTTKQIKFAADIAGAYPETAAVKTWKRSYELNRGKNFIITDEFSLSEVNGSTTLNFITICEAAVEKAGIIKLQGKEFTLKMIYNPHSLSVEIKDIPIDDKQLQNSWGNKLTQISIKYTKPAKQGKSIIEIKHED